MCLTASFLATGGFKVYIIISKYIHGLHAHLNTLLFLQSAFMLSVVKMQLKWDVGGHAVNSHGNDFVHHGKSWKNHGIVFLNFCGNPV